MDTLSQDLLSELECPVCYETMVPPIRLCLEGHSLCNVCRLQLEICPTCRKPLTNARNRVLEKVAEKLCPDQAAASSSQASVSLEVSRTTTRVQRVEHDFANLDLYNPPARRTESPLNEEDDDDDDDIDETDGIINDDDWITELEHFDTENTQHVGVTCDVCSSGVDGYRYKCLQCSDYDLCTVCEERKLHADHYMLRMPAPAFWCQHFGRNLVRRLSSRNDDLCLFNNTSQNNADGVLHRGVTCDGCGESIRGFRYKCIQCRDYDLCGSCEGRGIHSTHFMIRMPVPTTWNLVYGRSLAQYLHKSANKICSHSRREGQQHRNFRPLDITSRGELTGGNCHNGITCDGCRTSIHGSRFKCLQCFDYDLCSSCEGVNSHSEHYIVRMPDPMHKCQHIGRRIARRLCDEAFEDCCCDEGDGHCPLERRREGSVYSDDLLHIGVMCDGCTEDIRGFRYKCIECRNYDLCADCEKRGVHKEHFMIRMPVPTLWCQSYGQRLSQRVRREACRICEGH